MARGSRAVKAAKVEKKTEKKTAEKKTGEERHVVLDTLQAQKAARSPRCTYKGPTTGAACVRKASKGGLCTLHTKRAAMSGKFLVKLQDKKGGLTKIWGPYRASKANQYIAGLAEQVDPKRYRITRVAQAQARA